MHKTIIFKVLGDPTISLPLAAQECISLLGAGANTAPSIIEETFSLCNTPVQHGYIRVVANTEFAAALEQVNLSGYQSPYMQLVLIEWDGQTEFVTAEYDDPEFGHVRELLGYMAELPIVSPVQPD
ncbi:MAG TPA: hypothetical protein DCS09_04670 [Porphyromonadaceae bacterium]|nr:hypothetical protein [Porphyromonadaceae bacterium]